MPRARGDPSTVKSSIPGDHVAQRSLVVGVRGNDRLSPEALWRVLARLAIAWETVSCGRKYVGAGTEKCDSNLEDL